MQSKPTKGVDVSALKCPKDDFMVCFTVEGSISLEKETNDDKLCPRLLSHETLLFLHNEEAKEKSLSLFLHELFKPPLLLLIKTGKTALKRKDLIVTLVNIIYLFIYSI